MIKKEKAALRKQLTSQWSLLSAAYFHKTSAQVCRHIASAKQLLTSVDTIAIYAAHHHEIDLSQLHSLLKGTKLLYPLCHPKSVLTYHHVENTNDLLSGKYGIKEPDPAIHPEFSIAEIDLFFCPGVAFGRDGSRLGHGGGYYDRMLSKKSPDRDVSICAIAFGKQIHASLPYEIHDIKMDMIISENGIDHCQT